MSRSDEREVLRERIALALVNHRRERNGLKPHDSLGGLEDHHWRDQRRQADAILADFPGLSSAPIDAIEAAAAPWSDFHGELPDYDHPLRCVYESGIQYAVELLAKELDVTDYNICDGTEEFDGDLGGTMMNIVTAALPSDVYGDPIYPSQLSEMLNIADNVYRAAKRLSDNIAEFDTITDGVFLEDLDRALDAYRAGRLPASQEEVPLDTIHPAPAEFTPEQLTHDQILRYFHYAHLPPQLQSASKPFCDLAHHIIGTLPRNAERTVALRKLLEAKDAAVRANVQ